MLLVHKVYPVFRGKLEVAANAAWLVYLVSLALKASEVKMVHAEIVVDLALQVPTEKMALMALLVQEDRPD